MEDTLVGILVPIFICALMPVAIILIVYLSKMNADKKRAEVLIKAIEANNGVDADKLAEALQKPRKTPRELLNSRLLKGCIFFFVGLFLVAVGLANYAAGTEFSADPVSVPLVCGGISLPIGLSFLIVYFATRKQIEDCHEEHKEHKKDCQEN